MYWTWLYVWLFVLLVSRQVSSISVILTTCVVLIDLLVNAMWAVFQLYWRLVFYWLIYWSMPWGQYFSYIKRHSCWDKSYLNKDNLLLRWSHCYKNYMVVIAIWLRNIHISNNNGSFTVCLDFFISLSLARTWLYIWVTRWFLIRSRGCLPFASTKVHPTFLVRFVLLIFLQSYLRYLCLFAYSGVQHILSCGVFWGVFLVFFCLRLVSCVPNVASFSALSILDCPFDFSNVYFCYIDCFVV
jgi:hypothetical protein